MLPGLVLEIYSIESFHNRLPLLSYLQKKLRPFLSPKLYTLFEPSRAMKNAFPDAV